MRVRARLSWWRGLLGSACLLAAGAASAAGADAVAAASSAGAAAACPAAPAMPTAAEVEAGLRDARDAGFLWKATRDDRVVWLYGTVHVAKRDWIYPGPRVAAAMRGSDRVALELDPTDPDVLTRLQKAIAPRPGGPRLSPAETRRLEAAARAACLDPATLRGQRPEMAAVAVEMAAARRIGLHATFFVDGWLAAFARRWNLPVRGLETPEQQAAALVTEDPEKAARAVDDVLDEVESGRDLRLLGRLAEDWHAGRLDDLADYARWCECLRTPGQRADFRRLVDDRNPGMADTIVRWHDEGLALFVAVGSLHLVGPVGLPALLKARGFEVQRVEFSPH